ncbi:hypothetical protein BH09PSE6_BH09PSE6_17090 [soil metagenome]
MLVDRHELPNLTLAADSPASARKQAQEWAGLVQRIIKGLDHHHAGITTARKRDGLSRALSIVREGGSDELRGRLTRLVESWYHGTGSAPAIDVGEIEPLAEHPTRTAAVVVPPASPTATAIKPGAANAATMSDPDSVVAPRLGGLLGLVLSNIAELTPEHQQLAQQVEQINALLRQPFTEARLIEAERQLRALMIKQGAIRHRIEDAKNAIKEMMATLIGRLSAVSDATGSYSEKIEAYAGRIGAARDISQLSDVVKGLLDDTRVVSTDMARAHDDLVFARQKVREHEGRVEALERELNRIGELVRTDPLTQTLSRRGFEEVYAGEVARKDAKQRALSVALLDVDDFKQVNDTHGHHAGDQALRHLAEVLRVTLRPSDAIGRYGGEEFAILLPGTTAEQATLIMSRVQRELTKRIFLHNNDRIFITFSAGVAIVDIEQGLAAALERCDAAMYDAKRNGKNRVNLA